MAQVEPSITSTSSEPQVGVGSKMRAARLERGVGVRELARMVDCSASLISQIERGKANPSVNTLYAIANVLGISVDSMFGPHLDGDSPHAASERGVGDGNGRSPDTATLRSIDHGPSIIQHPDTRLEITLNHGVKWELLTPTPEQNVEFMEVTYDVGATSAARNEAMRHNGREYTVIVAGTLHAQIGFETFVLESGDSLAFDPTVPHRFWNDGDVPMRAIWFVLDRWTPTEERDTAP